MKTNISVRPCDIEVANIRWKNIEILLNFFLNFFISVISDLYLEHVTTLRSGIVNSIHVLILSCDVDDVNACCETAVSFCQGDDEGIDGVCARESFVVEDAAKRKTKRVSCWLDLCRHSQDYFRSIDDCRTINWIKRDEKWTEIPSC